jgi:hypothetical protein
MAALGRIDGGFTVGPTLAANMAVLFALKTRYLPPLSGRVQWRARPFRPLEGRSNGKETETPR